MLVPAAFISGGFAAPPAQAQQAFTMDLQSLNSAIEQQRLLVATLEARLENLQTAESEELRIAESRIAQQNQLFELELNELRREITRQEAELRAWTARRNSTVAIPGSDRDLALQNQIEEAGSRLNSLRERYDALVAERSAAIDQQHDLQQEWLSDIQRERVELRVELAEARSDLDRLRSEYTRLADQSREQQQQQQQPQEQQPGQPPSPGQQQARPSDETPESPEAPEQSPAYAIEEGFTAMGVSARTEASSAASSLRSASLREFGCQLGARSRHSSRQQLQRRLHPIHGSQLVFESDLVSES